VVGKVSARAGWGEVGGLVVPGDLLGVFQVGDEPDLDVADPFQRGGFAEGDAEHFCTRFCDLFKGGLQGSVVFPDVLPDAVCRKEEDRCKTVASRRIAGSIERSGQLPQPVFQRSQSKEWAQWPARSHTS
jgi:hypothetical protein